MYTFKFLHAADLHLDVPLPVPTYSNEIARAGFLALENLVQCALDEKVDALLLVGDIWNSEEVSLKARLALRKACEELEKENIKVFIVHGNHDPLEKFSEQYVDTKKEVKTKQGFFQSLKLPENVFIFTDEIGSVPFEKNGEILAIIHGISHAHSKETRNLSSFFPKIQPQEKEKNFHIALLHTSLANENGENIYAPCSLHDLEDKNYHYFALGHVHSMQFLNPSIAFSGALQGLSIREKALHGAILVELTKNVSDNFSQLAYAKQDINTRFISLAPLVWERIDFDFNEEPKTKEIDILTLQSLLADKIEKKTQELAENSCVKYCVFRVVLKGATNLNQDLRSLALMQEFEELLKAQISHLSPSCFVKDILVETCSLSPKTDIEELMQEDNFLAQVLREGTKLLENDAKEIIRVAHELYQEGPVQKQYKHILPPLLDEDSLKKIILQAQYLCVQNMETN